MSENQPPRDRRYRRYRRDRRSDESSIPKHTQTLSTPVASEEANSSSPKHDTVSWSEELRNKLIRERFSEEQITFIQEAMVGKETSKKHLLSVIALSEGLSILSEEGKKMRREVVADSNFELEFDAKILKFEPILDSASEVVSAPEPHDQARSVPLEVIKDTIEISPESLGLSSKMSFIDGPTSSAQVESEMPPVELVEPPHPEFVLNLKKSGQWQTLPSGITSLTDVQIPENTQNVTYRAGPEGVLQVKWTRVPPEKSSSKKPSKSKKEESVSPGPIKVNSEVSPVEQGESGSTTPEVAPATQPVTEPIAEVDPVTDQEKMEKEFKDHFGEDTFVTADPKAVDPNIEKNTKEWREHFGEDVFVEADAPEASVEAKKTPSWFNKFPNWVKDQKENINQEALTRGGERGVNAVRKTGEWYKKQNPWIKLGVGGALIGLGLGGGAIGGSLGGTIFAIGFTGKVVQRGLAASGAFVLAESMSRGLSKDKQLDKVFLKDKHTQRGLAAAVLTLAMPSIFSYTGAGTIMGQKLSLAGSWLSTNFVSATRFIGESQLAGAYPAGVAVAPAVPLVSANEFQPMMQEGNPFKGAIQPSVTHTPSTAMLQALQGAKVTSGSNLWNTISGTLPSELNTAQRQNAVGNIIQWLRDNPSAHKDIPNLTKVIVGTPLSSLQIPPEVLQNIYDHAKNPQVKLGTLSLGPEATPKTTLKETLEQVAKRAALTVGAPTEVMTSPGDATTLAAMVGSPSEMPLNISSETIADYAINKFGDAQKGGFFSKLFGSKLVSNIDWSKVSKLPASTIFDGTPNKFLTPVQLATLKADLLSVHNKVVGLDLTHKTVEEVIKVGLEKRILT